MFWKKEYGETDRPHRMAFLPLAASSPPVAAFHICAGHGAELQAGAMITAEPDRVRIRLPEEAGD
jgi:hypothetical protein